VDPLLDGRRRKGAQAVKTAANVTCFNLLSVFARRLAGGLHISVGRIARGTHDLPNVQDEPRPWLARLVLLGARDVTAMVVGSGALLGRLALGDKCRISNLRSRRLLTRRMQIKPHFNVVHQDLLERESAWRQP
jgi:hypothetical protein